jgi:hypothetical protein
LLARGKRSASLARGKRSASLFSDPCFQLSLVQKKVSHKGLESAQGLAGKSLGVVAQVLNRLNSWIDLLPHLFSNILIRDRKMFCSTNFTRFPHHSSTFSNTSVGQFAVA